MAVGSALSGKRVLMFIGMSAALVYWSIRKSAHGNGWSNLGSVATCHNCGAVKEVKVACPNCDYH